MQEDVAPPRARRQNDLHRTGDFAIRTTNGGYDEIYRARTPDQAFSSRGTQYRSGNIDLCDRHVGDRDDSRRTLAGLQLVLVSGIFRRRIMEMNW
jgi:hypothetical protein